jgi:hypothetical protein
MTVHNKKNKKTFSSHLRKRFILGENGEPLRSRRNARRSRLRRERRETIMSGDPSSLYPNYSWDTKTNEFIRLSTSSGMLQRFKPSPEDLMFFRGLLRNTEKSGDNDLSDSDDDSDDEYVVDVE